MDLVGLENYTFSAALLLGSNRKHHGMAWFSVNPHKASPLGPVFGLAVIVPSQCCTVSKSCFQLHQN